MHTHGRCAGKTATALSSAVLCVSPCAVANYKVSKDEQVAVPGAGERPRDSLNKDGPPSVIDAKVFHRAPDIVQLIFRFDSRKVEVMRWGSRHAVSRANGVVSVSLSRDTKKNETNSGHEALEGSVW